MNQSESAIRIFDFHLKHGKLFSRRERPVPQRPALHIVDAAMNELEPHHRLTLLEQKVMRDMPSNWRGII
jgi:hypothetical protein